ncbi:MAG TPA: amidase [Vicinamibacterales bacterium]|nr:amidase [Vicinamibacterales bacterium]
MTLTEFARAWRAREITSEDATARCLAQIDRRNSELRAFTLVLAGQALDQARQADRELAQGRDRGPLHGAPISIKDLIDLKGAVTSAASAVRAGAPAAAEDAPSIAHLRDAGAVFVGKTNLHEFALGTTSEDSAFGAVRNPLDPARSAGGSSGGSAVSIVTGMALASVGTDTGGSIRIPAAACGIVGLKPSYGEISTDGVIPLSPRLDHVGPLTASVADAWTMFRVLAGELHPAPLAPQPPPFRLKALRSYFCDRLDDQVRSVFETALEKLRSGGLHASDHALKHAHVTARVYLHIAPRESFLQHQQTLDTMADKYTPAVRQRLELGRSVSHHDFLEALNIQSDLREDVDHALSNCDALVLPTMPIPAPTLGATTVRVGDSEEQVRPMMLRLTQLFNLTGHPAISIPCGKTRDGLPVGLQLVGNHGRTDALVRVALTCEGLLK